MKKIIVFNWLSIDGFIAEANDETDWFCWNKEIEACAKEVQATTDTILFGRTTYQILESYWPTSASSAEPSSIVDFMNNTRKIVFSKTLEKVEWNNSKLMKEIIPDEIMAMKQQTGKNMLIYGSGSVISQLAEAGLIDEYMLLINPIALGSGKPLFQNMKKSLTLKHINTITFEGGCVLHHYRT